MVRSLTSLLLAAILTAAQAQDTTHKEPAYWELGVGFSGISFPDYLGSNERSNWLLPFPYFVYRSERLEVDREGVTGELFESPRWELDISLSGSLAVRSNDNELRKGMSDLDPILELGPELRYEIHRLSANNGRFLLELPIRTAIASDFTHIRDVGWLSNPNIRYERDRFGGDGTWNVDASFGAVFGNERYHDYFYGVSPGDATALRPAYEAKGGFGGWRLALGFSRRVGDFWYGGFIRYYDLSDAVYIDSPLVETESAWAGGFAMAWIFADSGKKDE
ncbi:MAG: MipA/OmpV family protein [Gammaproteobacteria bacterium]|nr:MipA/OmpV family protein [Gammaproteobacteria bacterium]MCP5424323.1 MipA/OmpV family protein [Gammaproteobacteria bacterium]